MTFSNGFAAIWFCSCAPHDLDIILCVKTNKQVTLIPNISALQRSFNIYCTYKTEGLQELQY